jgi:hypothetical protein
MRIMTWASTEAVTVQLPGSRVRVWGAEWLWMLSVPTPILPSLVVTGLLGQPHNPQRWLEARASDHVAGKLTSRLSPHRHSLLLLRVSPSSEPGLCSVLRTPGGSQQPLASPPRASGLLLMHSLFPFNFPWNLCLCR